MRRTQSVGIDLLAGSSFQAQIDVAQACPPQDVRNGVTHHADALAPPETSGCDSSDCSYCQSMARSRQMHGPRPACWLRQKRSHSDLTEAEPAGGTPDRKASTSLLVVPDVDVPRQPSIWDHALLEPGNARRVLDAQAQRPYSISASSKATISGRSSSTSTSGSGRTWEPWVKAHSYSTAPTPLPACLDEVACFHAAARDDARQSADITCAIEFEEHGWLVATAGVAKQIRVYSLASYLENPGNGAMQGPLRVHRTASKLSSLAWNPDQPGVVTVGDYDGVVSQLDVESGHMVAEADEHAGRRIWSVSHSQFQPHLVASASDDGTARLWQGPGLDHMAAAVRPARGASVCSVHFSPFDGNLLALACADAAAYVYDVRRLKAPLACLRSHSRPVSYARFMDARRLVTASTDATLAVWDMSSGGVGGALPTVAHRFQGHTNSKNFVGLSVRADQGLVACGSEHPAAYAYSLNWEQPLVEHRFDALPAGARSAGMKGMGSAMSKIHSGAATVAFCSAVCWQPEVAAPEGEPLLAAATSDGRLRVLALKHRVGGGPVV